MSEPSERMKALFREAINESFANGNAFAFPSEPIAPECVAGDALLAAIAALEQRAEKWKRVAVAREMCGRARDNKYYTDRSCGWLLSKRINELEKADSELIEAIAELGKEWTEAVK